MERRYRDLSELKSFNHKIDKEMTMILQNLQWNRSKLMEDTVKVTCRYDANHKIPPHVREIHEQECFLSCQGYSKEDKLLPDPLDINANTLVKLCRDDITQIIDNAKKSDPCFIIGPGAQSSEPCTLGRLQATYSADERRAIHDAVVEAVPFCHDLTDLALPSMSGDNPTMTTDKSRAEILAELRDMKRRRTKYRVAAKTRNYSGVLRDVIKTQMELYTEVQTETKIKIKTEIVEVENDSRHVTEQTYSKDKSYKTTDKDRIDNSTYQKHYNHKNDSVEDRYNREQSRYNEDQSNTNYQDRHHNVYKKEFHRRDESKEKYQKKSNRESRNDDRFRSKYNKEEREKDRPRYGRDRHRDERHDRKHSADNARERYNKYQNKASSSKDYESSHKKRDEKYKEEYKVYDFREIKEEGKYKRYYDDTIKDVTSKRSKYS